MSTAEEVVEEVVVEVLTACDAWYTQTRGLDNERRHTTVQVAPGTKVKAPAARVAWQADRVEFFVPSPFATDADMFDRVSLPRAAFKLLAGTILER